MIVATTHDQSTTNLPGFVMPGTAPLKMSFNGAPDRNTAR